MKSFRTAATLLVLPLALAAQAQTLEQKNMIAHDKTVVAERAAETNKKCETHIAFSMDYSTFLNVHTDPTNPNDQSPWSYLANVTDALNKICSTPDGKASVQAKIKTVIVSHGKEECESLQGQTFRYSVPYTGYSYDTIVNWLNKNL